MGSLGVEICKGLIFGYFCRVGRVVRGDVYFTFGDVYEYGIVGGVVVLVGNVGLVLG